MTLGPGTFTISAGNSDTYYLRGHPRNDAVRVDFDSANSGSTDVDIEVRVYDKDDPRAADSNSDFSSMDSVYSSTANDVSSGDPHFGHHGLARTVAVQVSNNATSGNADGEVKVHNSSDPAQSGASFANR